MKLERVIFVILLLATGGAVAYYSGSLPGMTRAAEHRFNFGGIGRGNGQFEYPRALAVSPVDGCVFVIDKTARVQRFSPDGKHELTWHMPEVKNGKPTGIFIDQQNHIWVPDTHYARVIGFDRDGNELFSFGERGHGPGQFIFPTSVAIDSEGFIYVSEYGGNDRVSKFTSEFEYIMSFANDKAGAGWMNRPQTLLIDEDDVIWATDSCGHRICRFDTSGKFLGALDIEWPNDETAGFSYPFGLDEDDAGRLLVSDRGNNRIVRLQKTGKVDGVWGLAGRAETQIRQPWAVSAGDGQRVYCLDSWNNRVQVIDW